MPSLEGRRRLLQVSVGWDAGNFRKILKHLYYLASPRPRALLNRNPVTGDDRIWPRFSGRRGNMTIDRALAFSILMSAMTAGSAARAGAGLYPSGYRRNLRRRPARDLFRAGDHLGRRHPLEPGVAASERHHRQQILRHRRTGCVRRSGQGRCAAGKSERAGQGAVSRARWRRVLLLAGLICAGAFSSEVHPGSREESASGNARYC